MISTRLAFTLLGTMAAAGCAINGPNDALTGTWTNSSCFGSATMPSDIQTCSIALTFDPDLAVRMTDERQSEPATAMFPRCTTTRQVTGQTYSTSNGTTAMTVTLTGDTTSTVQRTGCANAADNASAAPDTVDSIPAGAIPYAISGSVLTISSGPLAGQYSRSVL